MPPTAPANPPAAVPDLTLDLWPAGSMPGHGTDRPETAEPIGDDGVLRIGHVSRPTIAVCHAPAAARPVPAVIVCPGGAYRMLAYNKEGTEIAAWLKTLGVTAVILKYRVPGNREGARHDLGRAVRLVRLHARDWNVDPAKIGVMGFSAGAHLAVCLNSPAEPSSSPALFSSPVAFNILVYPGFLEIEGALSPELSISAQTPPTLIVQTEDDLPHVAGGKLYHSLLQKAAVPSQFLLYPAGGHGYGLRSEHPVKTWPREAAAWLRQIGFAGPA